MHNEKKTRRQTKKLINSGVNLSVLNLPSYASLVELTAKISQAQEDTDKERRKQPRKEGRKAGRQGGRKGGRKEGRKERRKD